jgi:hypothetical protein
MSARKWAAATGKSEEQDEAGMQEDEGMMMMDSLLRSWEQSDSCHCTEAQ